MKLEVEQTKLAYQYKDIKLRLCKTSENIKFNKACIEHNLVPNYVQVKVAGKSLAALKAKKTAQFRWIKNEIKGLYSKKDLLNKLLFRKHLEILNKLHASQHMNIFNEINQQISKKILQKKSTQKKKINSLIEKQHKQDIIKCSHTFFKRVVNNTEIKFSDEELNLLNKGLNFNFPSNKKSSLFSELLNTEASIKSIKSDEVREAARILIGNKAKHICKQTLGTRKHDRIFSSLRQALRSIRNKLVEHDALITKSDKGSSIVILYKDEYINKVTEFFNNNSIELLHKDPTLDNAKLINRAISESTNLLTKNEIFSLKVTNPQAPILRGLPKIHKPSVPIRPLVNFMPSPAYRVAKKLDKIIRNEIVLENSHSIKNSFELIDELKNKEIKGNHKLVSFDIVNLYTNIPVHETISILQENLQKNSKLSVKALDELIILTKLVLTQNYFRFQNDFYIQKEGLAMGSPLSSILAEIFLNHIENKHLFTEANRYREKMVFYYRYVDDTIVLFNGNSRQLTLLNTYLCSMHKKIKFTLEEEKNNSLNFLDLTISKQDNHFTFKIYRKPTCTDQTIHADSHHPYSQKVAAYNSFVHRLLTVPMKSSDYNEEINILKHIAVMNGFNSNLIDKLIAKHLMKSPYKLKEQKTYISADYGSSLSHTFKNIMNKNNITVSFKTRNKLGSLLKERTNTQTPIYDKCGVYKINCTDCQSYYIGQTSRSFKKRFKEHLPRKTTTPQTSNFAEHLVNQNHSYTNINSNMEVLHFSKDRLIRNTLEEFEIYKAVKSHSFNVLNDKLSFQSNYIYNTAIRILEKGEECNRATGDKDTG